MSLSPSFSWSSRLSMLFLSAAAVIGLPGCAHDAKTPDQKEASALLTHLPGVAQTLDQKRASALLTRFAEVAGTRNMQQCLIKFSEKYKPQTVSAWYLQPPSQDNMLQTFVAYKGVFCSRYRSEGVHPSFVIFKVDDPKTPLWLTQTSLGQVVLLYRGLSQSGEVQFSASSHITGEGLFLHVDGSVRPSLLRIAKSINAFKQPLELR